MTTMAKVKTAKIIKRAWNGFSGISSWSKSAKKAGSRAHKAPDKITPEAKRLANIARNQFGISLPALESVARTANPEKMKLILAMGETGENQKMMSPLISQAIVSKIEGVAAVNKMNADVISATARGAVDIKRSINSTIETSEKYGNQIREANLSHKYRTEAEQRRHEHSNQAVVMSAYVQEHLDKKRQMQGLQQKVLDVQAAQIDADRAYKERQLAMLSSQGSHADFNNIARVDYDIEQPKARMQQLDSGNVPMRISRTVRGLFNYLKGSDI